MSNDYRKIYKDFFDLGELEYIECEICGRPYADVHHIEFKGMGGSKLLDTIENLIGLCRRCHKRAHGEGGTRISKERLYEIHQITIKLKSILW